MIHRVFISAVLVTAIAATCMAQRSVKVYADPALSAPLKTVSDEFKKLHKDAKVEFVNRTSATVLLGPPSIHRSVNRRLFALDRLVLVAPLEPKRITKFAHIGLNLKFAVLKPSTAEGALAAQLMEQARTAYGRDWWANTKRNSSVTAADSQDAVRLVLDGKADAALALSSDASPHAAKLRAIPLPPDMVRAIEHFASARGDSLSQAFVDFLYSKGNQQRLVAAGFASPLSPAPELAITMPGSMMKLFTSALGTHKQETVGVTNGQGKRVSFKGASLRAILSKARGQVRFVGADGASVSVPMSSIRQRGGVLAPMGDGNFQVVLPGRSAEQALRWVRRIEVQ